MNIKTLCLGILYFEDTTGYEINKLVSEGKFSHFIEASYGSIYPALTKLMQEELVTCRQEHQEGKPSRKVYSITAKGRAVLIESLQEIPKPDIYKSQFLFLCLYSGLLGTEHMSMLVDHKIQELADNLAHMKQCCENYQHPGVRFAIGYGQAIDQAALTYIQNNRSLLENEAVLPEHLALNLNDPEDRTGQNTIPVLCPDDGHKNSHGKVKV